VVNAEGELIELTDRRTIAAVSQAKDKIRFFQELKFYAGDRGYKQGWAAYKSRRSSAIGLKGWTIWRRSSRRRRPFRGSSRSKLRMPESVRDDRSL
jgi:hypothetical protein